MIEVTLTNTEWYFLHVQLEKIIQEHPENHIAKGILMELAINKPLLSDISDIEADFKKEYEGQWINKKQ